MRGGTSKNSSFSLLKNGIDWMGWSSGAAGATGHPLSIIDLEVFYGPNPAI